jgi:hypothetical protein
MSRPRFRMPSLWSACVLVVALALGACGDRGSGRPQGTGEEAAPDTSVEQRGDTVAVTSTGADTVRRAAAVQPTDTTSSAGAASPARGNVTGHGNAAPTPDTSAAVAAAAAAAAALDSAYPFMPVTITLEMPPAPIRPRVLRDVRAGRHPGFERVVFEMAGDTLPGYRITYVNPPVVACGSGRHVSLAGKATLVVRLEPAQAHDEAGHATIEDRRQKPDFPVLQEMALTCDFEGQVQWALGLDRQVPFRVLKLQHPARLVLDLQEGS